MRDGIASLGTLLWIDARGFCTIAGRRRSGCDRYCDCADVQCLGD